MTMKLKEGMASELERTKIMQSYQLRQKEQMIHKLKQAHVCTCSVILVHYNYNYYYAERRDQRTDSGEGKT